MSAFLSRIIFCISLIFSCCTFNTSGSTSTSQQKQVDTSISEAEIIYKSNFKQAYTIADDAKNRAVNINYLQGIVASSCLLSLIESQTNRSNTAIEALNKLLFTLNLNNNYCQH